jgi:hypothetical protein
LNRKTAKFTKICCSLLDTFLSGSPILQDGKIVGAVTHVLVDDPTRGYGVFIETMLGNTLMHREYTSSYAAKFVIEKD